MNRHVNIQILTSFPPPRLNSSTQCTVRLLTKEQLMILEKEFSKNIYVTSVLKEKLATKLNINPIQVAVWYKNRRLSELRKLTNKQKKKKPSNTPKTASQIENGNGKQKENKPPNTLPTTTLTVNDNGTQQENKPLAPPVTATQTANDNGTQQENKPLPTTAIDKVDQLETWGDLDIDFHFDWNLSVPTENNNTKQMENVPTAVDEKLGQPETWGDLDDDFSCGWNLTRTQTDEHSFYANELSLYTPPGDCGYDFFTDC